MRIALVIAAALCALLPAATPSVAQAGRPASWDTCTSCHENVTRNFATTPHASSPAGCQGCHGPADEHVASGGDPSKIRRFAALSARERVDVCLGCHQKGDVALWTGSRHDRRKLDCSACHDPHPKGAAPHAMLREPPLQLCGSCHAQQQSKMFRSGHMPVREGKMSCTSCHNPHGTLSDRMLRQNSVNENCYSCHAEVRGPFVWEHAPVRENCATCHDPHGSINRNMIRVRQPILCQTCHVASRHPSTTNMATERPNVPGTPSGASARSFGQSCLDCHPMVHGTNHPGGRFFVR